VFTEIRDLVERTPLADTHEHLLEESSRLEPGDNWRLDDIGILFSLYVEQELASAGMPEEDRRRMLLRETPPDEKWHLVRPWWPLMRQTGYGMTVRESILLLFGEDDITDENWEKINDGLKALIKPGYYEHLLLDVARLDHCQVNSVEKRPFLETAQPELLHQDLSFVAMASTLEIELLSEQAGKDVRHLKDWLEVIDWCFEQYGPKAIALKNQAAYLRRLDFESVLRRDAERSFDVYLKKRGESTDAERKPAQDFLFNYCIRKAVEYRLPVKIHTGYMAGNGMLRPGWLRHHAEDMAALCRLHPDARFILMHITWPHQDEAIAMAKHYENAVVDMCWAWSLNPIASRRFLKEFLLSAPANKVLAFGGDVTAVEMVPGAAAIARRGISQVLEELVEEKWLRYKAVPGLVQRLATGNARDLFPRLRN